MNLSWGIIIYWIHGPIRRDADLLAFQLPEMFRRGKKKHEVDDELALEDIDADSLAVEFIRNGRREFVVHGDEHKMQIVEKKLRKTLGGRLVERLMRYFLPVGYPHSVGPGEGDPRVIGQHTVSRCGSFAIRV